MININLNSSKKIYFSSDNHLGAPDQKVSFERELRFISWLDLIKKDAQTIFLLGDLFDFWFEYKHVVPKGYTRLFGKLAELSDSGIEIFFFTMEYLFPSSIIAIILSHGSSLIFHSSTKVIIK